MTYYLGDIIIGILMFSVLIWLLSCGRKNRHLLKHGLQSTAKVSSIEKTIIEYGKGINSEPLMKITLEIEAPGGTHRQVTIKQSIKACSIPRVGDTVYILVDPRNPARVMIAPEQNTFEIAH